MEYDGLYSSSVDVAANSSDSSITLILQRILADFCTLLDCTAKAASWAISEPNATHDRTLR